MKDSLCEAQINGYCKFGCDLAMNRSFKAEEMIEKNYFDCYETQKECKTLKEYRNNQRKEEEK